MIIVDDVLNWLKNYAGEKFHAILCDPPYELGFMGKDWDKSGIAFNPETWRSLAEHLHPGGFLMAFASSRGWHRLAVAIEDAGFVIHPTIFGWSFGSGFPKATRIDTQVDKAAGAERGKELRPIAYPDSDCWSVPNKNSTGESKSPTSYGDMGLEKIAAGNGMMWHGKPATPLARAWAGHRYGLQALKPSLEPIIVASKPLLTDEFCDDIFSNINISFEELWDYANAAEDFSRAEQTVNIVLTAVLNLGQASGKSSTAITAENQSTNTPPYSATITNDSARASATRSTTKTSASEPASSAEKSLSHQERTELQSIVQRCAGTNHASGQYSKTHCETEAFTDTRAVTLRVVSARAKLDLSTIWLWRLIWDDLYAQASRCITKTDAKLITELRTLSYSLRKLTHESRGIASTRSLSAKALSCVQDVNNRFTALLDLLTERGASVRSVIEPIIVAQKPYKDKAVDCITRTGAGALWVDGGRITGQYETRERKNDGGKSMFGTGAGGGAFIPTNGRWPANFILHHRPECNGKCVEGCAVAALDRQSGEKPGKIGANGYWGMSTEKGWNKNNVPYKSGGYEQQKDFGGASRFFFRVSEQIDAADPIYYTAKASRRERDAGLDGMELIQAGRGTSRRCVNCGKPIVGLTQTDKCDCDNRQEEHTAYRNPHPTVKPIALARYLATLLLPPAEYAPRRLLVPFAGIGSEMIGAIQAGWEDVVGIEKNSEYAEIGEKRIEFYSKKPHSTQQLNFIDEPAV